MGWLHWLSAAGWVTVWALALWGARRTPTSGMRWASIMFAPLSMAALIAAAYPAERIEDPQGLVTVLLERIVIALVLGFPVALFHFAAALTARNRGAVVVSTGYFVWLVPVFFVPPDIAAQRPTPWWLTVLGVAIAAWFLASTVTASLRLLSESRRRTAVVAHRLRLLGVASLLLSGAVALSAIRDPQALTAPQVVTVATETVGLLSAALFAVALAPPRWLVTLWREPPLADVRRQTPELLSMTSRAEVIERIVGQVAAATPSGRAGFLARDERPVLLLGISRQEADRPERLSSRRLVPVGDHGHLVVWPDPEDAPLQGGGHEDLVVALATVLGLALSRLDSNSELREELEVRRTTEAVLTEQTEMLRGAKREVEEFLAIAGHDLTGPVRAIQDNLEYLRHDLPDADPQVRADLAAIDRGAQRLTGLLDGLRNFSRAGSPPPDPVPVELRDIVERALAHKRPDLLGVGADVRIGALAAVRADPAQVEQVMIALLDNAIRFRHRERSLRLLITAQHDQDTVVVRVQDNGTGIAGPDRERVFDMFTRIAEPDSAGNGVGLAVCRRIVEAHGGTIGVESGDPFGSVFHFSLPVAAVVTR